MVMNDTLRLGRIGGVRVGLNWTLLAMAVFLAVALAQNRLPYDAPGYAAAAYWVAGAAAAVVLLLTILLHELGHAVVARRAGLRVDGITLWFMGGITRIEGEASSPGAELRISGVGPLISGVIGGALWGLSIGLEHLGTSPLAVHAVAWLGVINVALAVFNLLPGAPLDGGRVLHAAVWAVTRDRWRATRVASGAGALIGGLLAVAGFVAFAHGDSVDGVLLAVLGWFLFTSARSEEQVATIHRALDGVTVARLMRPVRAAPGWLTVDALLSGYGDLPGSVLMLERWGGGFDGVASLDALAEVPYEQRHLVRGVDVAVPIAQTEGAAVDDPVVDAIARPGGRKVLLVISGGHTVGALLPADVDAWLRQTGGRPLH